MPADSHVSRSKTTENGGERQIYRRNTAYGGPNPPGHHVRAFCGKQRPFEVMLARMAGAGDGAYYAAPSVPALSRLL